jgi:tetratricopeptide (TPR) repeat protein
LRFGPDVAAGKSFTFHLTRSYSQDLSPRSFSDYNIGVPNFWERFSKHQWARRGILCAPIVVAVILAYLPALRGGFVWDDDAWTTGISGLLRDFSGLWVVWRHPAALPQYYPLTGTTFWIDYQLWGFWTTPYHVENVLLHALAALLFCRLLLRLQLPGAWLAAALFALHPVMVESVAWITERKNVLSLVLYLAALLAYLRYAQGVSSVRCQVSRTDSILSRFTFHVSRFYGLALVLFLGALLAKTTAFSLPAVILLLAWWQRGGLRWRADVLPTLPFFALSISLCLVTAWLEKNHVGAQGSDFDLSWPQRCLVAGRVPWFYLGQLFWPANLCFVYPRWQPDPGVWWQWLYPAGTVGGLFALWLMRGRIGRGPVTALFYFVGTLFPLLGFMNAYFMRYSFVCDHWVYLSSLGVLALVAALVVRAAEYVRKPMAIYGFAVVVLPVLGILTWRQAGAYRDMETLWRNTLAKNPECWMAQNNLGALLFGRGKPAEAETLYRAALQLNPGYAEAHSNLGTALATQGKLAEAIEYFDRALQLKPDYAEGHYNLGIALAAQRKWAEAIQHYEWALQLKPNYVDALYNLGTTLAAQGKLAEAIEYFDRVLQLKPDYAGAHFNLGTALAIQGKPAEAIEHFNRVLQLKPDYAGAHFNLGLALAGQGKSAEAVQQFQQALILATAQGNTPLAAAIRARLQAYPPALPQPQTP